MHLIAQRRSLSRPAVPWERPPPGGDGRSARGGSLQRLLAADLPVFGGIAMLGVLAGVAVGVAGLNALYLCAATIGCAFILRDFRIGVVLLILLMPISESYVFPHKIFGVTGLNPLNLLLVGTFGSYLIRAASDGSLRRFVPHPLLWLYVVPILVAGAIGSRHLGDIAPVFFISGALDFHTVAGYLTEIVAKPLLLVIFALLVAAAVSRSRRPERFLVPTLISIWVMGAIVIGFVFGSGVSLHELASSESRAFLSALGLHANELGHLYAIAYALLLFTWAESKSPGLAVVLLASMAMTVVALVLTFSRGAFVAFGVVNLLFFFWRRNTKSLIFIGLLAAVALFALPGAVYERATTGFGSGMDVVSAGRVDMLWLPLLPELLHSPIYGNGLQSILWSEPMRNGAGVTILPSTHPHNAYLQAVLDMGVVGLILLSAYFTHVWRGFRRLSVDPAVGANLRGFFQGAATGLLGLLVADFTDSSLAPRPEQIFLWVAVGMMYGQLARSRTNGFPPDFEPRRVE